MLNRGTCFENCPPVRIFDEDIGDFVKNPDFKFKLDGLCVKPCPGMLVYDQRGVEEL